MTYRIIQWGAGNTGRVLLKEIINHPDLELVGVYVNSPEKEGVDAGELCGVAGTGIRATRNKAALLALQADCVLHNARFSPDTTENDADVIALLASGKNVITIVPGLFAPACRGPAIAARMEAACREGGSTLFGTGLSPGVVNWLALVATGMSASLEELSYTEIYDPSPAPRANILDVMGMGRPAEEFTVDSPRGTNYFNMFQDMAYAYAAALSCTVTSVERDVRIGLATRDLKIVAGTVRKGTVAAVAWSVTATTDMGPRIRCVGQRIVQPDLDGWLWEPGWSAHMEIKGTPTMKISFRSDPKNIETRDDLLATVTAQLRAIPEVVAAPPGILIPQPPRLVAAPSLTQPLP